MSGKIKVLLVEDHPLTRQTVAFGLKKLPQFEIAGEVSNGREAIDWVHNQQPDVILMDIVLPVLNGIEATRTIKQTYPDIKVIMLTSHGDQEKVFEAFTVGAEGYCLKDIKIERLAQAIEVVLDGVVWLDPDVAGFILKAVPLISESLSKTEAPTPQQAHFELSSRETDILQLIAEGLSNKDIADKLCLSIHTVKNHVKSIIQKLAVEDRTQAAILALKKGLF